MSDKATVLDLAFGTRLVVDTHTEGGVEYVVLATEAHHAGVVAYLTHPQVAVLGEALLGRWNGEMA